MKKYILAFLILGILPSCAPIERSPLEWRIYGLDYQCVGGRVNSCEQLVEIYQNQALEADGKNKAYALKQSVKYLDIACKYGFFYSCYTLAGYYQDGYIVKQSFSKSQKLYDKACHKGLGISESCKKL